MNAAATAAAAHTGRVSLSPRLVAVIADELSELPGAEPWRSEVLRRAATFQRALRDGAVDAVIAAAASLAGLGEGSTPAGDDYLVGALHALTGGDPIAAASQPVASALGGVGERRTTATSAAWLAAAGRGAASPVWRQLLEAVAAGDETAVRLAARTVRATGHTSGAYSLRGFLDVLTR